MKQFYLLLSSFLILNSTTAQLIQNWANNFCCFDSVQPHTFSYPLGNTIVNDTLHLTFFEDGFLNYKQIDVSNGLDLQTFIDTNDTIESPFYFGGGSIFLQNTIVSAAFKYTMSTGQSRVWISAFDYSFNLQWNTHLAFQGGRISKPVLDSSGNSFFLATISDSIRVYKYQTGGTLDWDISIAKNHSDVNKDPRLLFNSLGQVVLLTEAIDQVNFFSRVQLTLIDPANGNNLADSVLNDSTGINFIYDQHGDTLSVAYINNVDQAISFMQADLLTLHELNEFQSSVPAFTQLIKFSIDPLSGIRYLQTADAVIAYSPTDSIIFNTNISNSSYENYSFETFSFDQYGHILVSYSFHNSTNSPENSDIKSIVLNKTTGTIEDEKIYNSNRNTSDIFLSQFLTNGTYYVLFSTIFDNANILQEETELGILSYTPSLLNVPEQKQEFKLVMYPNPVSDFLTVTINNTNYISEVFMYNIIGKKVLYFKTDQTNTNLDMSAFPPGVYIIQVKNKDLFISKSIVK